MTDLRDTTAGIIAMIPLAQQLGVACSAASSSSVTLELPRSAAATNHVGTVYAGASFTLAELAAGALLAIVGGGELIPVLVGAEVEYIAPAASSLTAHAELDQSDIADIRPQLKVDRRAVTELTVQCLSDTSVCVLATYRYRWLRVP